MHVDKVESGANIAKCGKNVWNPAFLACAQLLVGDESHVVQKSDEHHRQDACDAENDQQHSEA